MPMTEPIANAMALIAELAHALGVHDINRLSGCWEHQVDEHWWFACNGHAKSTPCSKKGPAVLPFHCYLEFNGWPAGMFSAAGGTIAAGSLANEETFSEALTDAITKAMVAHG